MTTERWELEKKSLAELTDLLAQAGHDDSAQAHIYKAEFERRRTAAAERAADAAERAAEATVRYVRYTLGVVISASVAAIFTAVAAAATWYAALHPR